MCEICPGTIGANLPDTLENREKVLRTQLPDWPIVEGEVMEQLTISALLCSRCKKTETQAYAQSLQAEEANLQEAMLQSAQEYTYILEEGEDDDIREAEIQEAIAVSLADCTTRGEDEDEDIREAMRLTMVDDSERRAIIGPPIGTRVTMEELDANRSATASDREVMDSGSEDKPR